MVQHRTVGANGIRIHLVEQGDGPLVLLVHGFPESWWSWRHQLPALAAAGYRAVAMDARGYGRSSAPSPIEAYRTLAHVGDCVGVVEALGADRAVIVGHDWGAPTAWTAALLRPDLFHAVAGLSVPYAPPGRTRPTAALAALAGDEEFYINYFQQPGRAEAEIEDDVAGWLLGIYYTASAAGVFGGKGTMATIPAGAQMRDRFQRPADGALPGWLPAEDFAFFVDEFERTGLTGGLNRYRNIDRDWEDLSAFRGRPITVPALFLGGSKDGPTIWGQGSISRFPQTLPKLWRSVIVEGCGHWVQQERPGEVNEALIGFLASL